MAKTTIRDIEWAVCQKFQVTREILLGRSTLRKHARPRQILMYLAREMTGLSYPRIGKALNRDPRTAMHAVAQIGGLLKYKPDLAAHIVELRAAITPVSLARVIEEAKATRVLLETSERRKRQIEKEEKDREWEQKLAALQNIRTRGIRGKAFYLRQPICLPPRRPAPSELNQPTKAQKMGGRA